MTSGPATGALRRDAAANRRRLLDAAERVFAERGPEASMEEIARAAEVSPATLYRRFPTKDGLVREVLATFFGQLVELAGQALSEPPQRCLDVYFETVGYQLAARRGFMHGMWGELAPAHLVTELEARTGQLLDRAQRGAGIAQSVTLADIAATIWALRGIIHTAGEAAPDAWRRHLGYVLAGFRGPSSTASASSATISLPKQAVE
ncbi:TetR/AcrR family transcriptional regulator [Micromonospora krabiensis]|uniref:Transcriptional regulator, TetR family n=1 Tax=Micromonospora krabiensis TaxID=307121 RepID=A0A1C3NCD8_9ACTN|nr:TetR/AcrR family transcriptional regulator [Micromonospora krabiensis]SBV30257.1 transcriptional regulator, TetR family [Micromonospora krabiensis]